jgi:hypothetical protein
MWATLAFAVAVTTSTVPAQGGPLKLSNARATYGFLGAPRAENAVLPGDVYFITFDIENLTMKDDGEVTYKMGLELINDKNKVLFGEEPQEKKARNSLGGKSLPAFAATEVGTNTPPGKYTVKVTVIDPNVKGDRGTQTLETKFEVLPAGFGIVRLNTVYLSAPVTAPPVLVPGQSILVNFSVVGFERAKGGDKQPGLGIQMRVVDDATNKPVLDKPIEDQVPAKDRKVPEDLNAIPISMPLDVNRTGKFTIELQVTDRVNTTAKPVTVKLPIHVVDK